METSSVFNVSLFPDNMTSPDSNVTERDTPESATGASIVSPIVMFLAGLIGNVLALMVLHKTKTEIRSVMFYTLVAALTWNDLVGICLTSPPVLAAYLNQRQMPALPTLCRFHALAMVCFGLSTPFIVCTMAIERSLALKCSYFYSKYCTPSSARVLVAMLWAFVLVFGALPLFDIGSFTLQYPQTWCFLDFRPALPVDMAYSYAYAIINLVVVVVMIFCNALVMTTLCQVRKNRRMSNASVNSTLLNTDAVEEKVSPPQQLRRRHHRDVELQMIWLLCAITTIFSVCWVPLMAYILFSLNFPDNHSPVFGLVAVRLASLNQTINPWIYVILRKSLLSRLRKLCQECLMYEDDIEPPRPLRKPLREYPRVHMRAPAYPRGRPNNYVHVRHQLCPSSQFVGQQNEFASMAEGQRRQSKGSGSSSRSRSQGSQGSHSVCSVCRARMRMNRVEAVAQESSTPYTPSHSLGDKNQDCSLVASPVCSAVGDGSTEHPGQPVSFTEGHGVRYFSFLPSYEMPCSQEDSVDRYSENSTPCRQPSGRSGAASAANIPSFISEADDHGYSSKVSTDSSRNSTPERPQPTRVNPADSEDLAKPPIRVSPEECNDLENPQDEQVTSPLPSSSGAVLGPLSVKQNGFIPANCRDDSTGLTSGTFDSREDVCNSGMNADGEDNDEEVVAELRPGRSAASRTMSCPSAGTRSESSSSHDRSTVIHRQLSSSSGH